MAFETDPDRRDTELVRDIKHFLSHVSILTRDTAWNFCPSACLSSVRPLQERWYFESDVDIIKLLHHLVLYIINAVTKFQE